MIGWPEWLLIGLGVLVLFGAKRLPEIGKGLGKGIRSFRDEFRGANDDDENTPDSDKQDKTT